MYYSESILSAPIIEALYFCTYVRWVLIYTVYTSWSILCALVIVESYPCIYVGSYSLATPVYYEDSEKPWVSELYRR